MSGRSVFLKVLHGEDEGKGWELQPDQKYELGRSRTCPLRLTDVSISGTHARLECSDAIWHIADLESTHGTRVNDQRILSVKPLFDRDRIRLGRTVLEFREYEELNRQDRDEIDRGVLSP
ncbi:MAG: FHA domain-containing protein [Planctomycetota bacterium]